MKMNSDQQDETTPMIVGDVSMRATDPTVDSTLASELKIHGKSSRNEIHAPTSGSTKTTNEGKDGQKKRRVKRKKKWSKPDGKPKRPLSAYNIFFAEMRIEMLGDDVPTPEQEAMKKKVHCKTHGKISFAAMAQTIGTKWKSLTPEKKKIYESKAQKEKDLYRSKLALWKESTKNGNVVSQVLASKLDTDTTSTIDRRVNLEPPPLMSENSELAVEMMAKKSLFPPNFAFESRKGQPFFEPAQSLRETLMNSIIDEEISRLRCVRSDLLSKFLQSYGMDQTARDSYRSNPNAFMPLSQFERHRYLSKPNWNLRSMNSFLNPSNPFQEYDLRYQEILHDYEKLRLLHERSRGMIDL